MVVKLAAIFINGTQDVIILMLFVKMYVIYRDANHFYMLYFSLILPYLSYVCEIWENTYKFQLHTTITTTITKESIRNMPKASYLDHTQPLFVQY